MSGLMFGVFIAGTVAAVLVPLLLLRRDLERQHRERLTAMFVTGLAPIVARSDARELIAWSGAIGMARKMYPNIMQELDLASGEKFPFTTEVIEDAHSQWTADWLTWERHHDIEFKERTRKLLAQSDSASDSMSQADRVQLGSIEDEKLQSYQQKYEEYIRIGNALSALKETADSQENHK